MIQQRKAETGTAASKARSPSPKGSPEVRNPTFSIDVLMCDSHKGFYCNV